MPQRRKLQAGADQVAKEVREGTRANQSQALSQAGMPKGAGRLWELMNVGGREMQQLEKFIPLKPVSSGIDDVSRMIGKAADPAREQLMQLIREVMGKMQ